MRGPTPGFKSALTVAVVVLLGVSGGMLWDFGYNYDGLTGSALTKIHPFTYFAFVALAWRALQSGDPFRFASAKIAARPAAAWMLALSFLLVVTTLLRSGPGLAGYIDTFGSAAVLALLIDDFGEDDIRPLTLALHVMMTLNALLGLAEYASSTLVFPYRFDGAVHLEDPRSTSLQGHPLMNAALTGVYVVSLMAGAKSLKAWTRALLIALQFAALVVFGGRTAMVVALALAPLIGLAHLFSTLKRGRVSLLAVAALTAAVPLAAVAVLAAVNAGLADNLLMRFVDDNGSAATRVIMFDMLTPFSWLQLLVGPDIEFVEAARWRLGLEQGVENPFIRMTLYQGGFLMALVFVSLIWFFRELLRGRGWGVLGPVVAMAVLLNASESVSVKTNFLDKLALIYVCLFPLGAQRRFSPSASSMAGSSVRSRSSIRPMLSNRHQKAQGKPNASALSRTSLT